MDDQPADRESIEASERSLIFKRVAWASVCVLVLIVLPLVPLAIEAVEVKLAASSYTSDICRKLGIFEPLTAPYRWLGLIN